MKAQARYRPIAGACCNPPVYQNLALGGMCWFPKWALPCPLAGLYSVYVLNLWLFSSPHTRGLCLLTISVTGDQSTLSFITDVLKFKMFSLKSTQAAGQCSPLIFNLLTSLPTLLLPQSLLILNSSGCPKEHATIKQEDQKQVPIISLQTQYIHSTSLITDSQDRFTSLVLETEVFLITFGH